MSKTITMTEVAVIFGLIAVAFWLIMPELAMATGTAPSTGAGTWVEKPNSILSAINSGFGTLVVGGATLGASVLGTMAAISGRMEWSRLGMIVAGGALATGATAIANSLF